MAITDIFFKLFLLFIFNTFKKIKPPQIYVGAQKSIKQFCFFYHPDYTVGFGITPNQPKRLAGFNCRWGITPRPEEYLVHIYFISQYMLCQALRCKKSSNNVPWIKNINGSATIKLLCFVLWRIIIIVKYIPNAPPIAEREKRVFSLMRHLPRCAFILSAIQTIIATILIRQIYISRYLMLYHQIYFTQVIPLFQSVFLV